MFLKLEPFVKKQLFIATCVYIGQILIGIAFGWTAPVIPKLQDPETSPLPDLISETQASLIGSLLYAGGIAGPYISGFLSNVIGRKPCLLLGGSIAVLAYLILILGAANSLAMIYAGRVLSGISSSLLFGLNLVYIGEIASTNLRGVLLTGTGIFTTLGTLLVYSVGPFVPYSVTGYIAAGIAVLYCIGIIFIPETPLFFIMKDNLDAAKKVLNDLGRYDEIDKLYTLKNPEENTSFKKAWTHLFTIKSNRRAVFITLTLYILQQCSGFLAILFFVTTIFDLAGSSIEPHIATIVVGVTQTVGSCFTPMFVERNGRKILMLASTACCCLTLAVLGLYFYLDEINHASAVNLQWLPLVSLIIYILTFGFGFGIIPGTLVGELFQSDVRSTGSALTFTIGSVFGFGVATAFGYVINVLGGHVIFWTFSGVCAVTFLFTLFFVPETKGKSFAEIQKILSK